MLTQAALVTLHAKQSVIGPAFENIGWTLETVAADTNSLGTFAGDVARPASALETARRKALLGATLSDAPWLVASEGSIHELFATMSRDDEIVVAVDRATGTTIVGHGGGFDIVAVQMRVDASTTGDDIVKLCERADLPRHHLLAVGVEYQRPAIGALGDVRSVLSACRSLLQTSSSVNLQTDFRANLCPSRRAYIAAAAQDMTKRLACRCPRCNQPGFGLGAPISGLLCMICRTPTPEIRAQRERCEWCAYEIVSPLEVDSADPRYCPRCNP